MYGSEPFDEFVGEQIGNVEQRAEGPDEEGDEAGSAQRELFPGRVDDVHELVDGDCGKTPAERGKYQDPKIQIFRNSMNLRIPKGWYSGSKSMVHESRDSDCRTVQVL